MLCPWCFQATLTVFQILTADDWPLVMHGAWWCGTARVLRLLVAVSRHASYRRAATYKATGSSVASLLYFVLVTLIGMYIIMSLFIAIILEKFACQDDFANDLQEHYAEVRS